MGRVSTNNISLSYGIQPAFDQDPTEWNLLEPNDIGTFGPEIATVARAPISRNRQRRKGTITDLDSTVEFTHDLTTSVMESLIEGFMFARGTNTDLKFRAAVVTGTGYTIAAASAAQAAKLQFAANGPVSLVFARGYTTPANNGLKVLSGDVAPAGTEIPVAGLVAEATPPGNSYLDIAGVRTDDGDLSVTIVGTTMTVTSGNGAGTALDFTTLSLTVGQYVHVGGLTGANQFSTGAAYGRIQSIAAGSLIMTRIQGTIADATSVGVNIDLLFGRYIRNVPIGDPDYVERYFTFEAEFPNLADPGPGDEYGYALNNLCNEMTINLALTDKATIDFAFVGTDTEPPSGTRKPGADTPVEPQGTGAFNTSSDIARLIVQEVDETGISTDFKDLSLSLNNNVSAEKVLAKIGARFINVGNFDVDLEGQLLFTSSGIPRAVRNNTTVGTNFRVENDDGAIYFDIASMTLGGGDNEYPTNETVLVNFTGQAFADPLLDTSLGISLFPVVPS